MISTSLHQHSGSWELFIAQFQLNMLSTSLITIALVGTTKAFTPPGFEPVSSANLTVAFGNTLAIDGVDLPKSGL